MKFMLNYEKEEIDAHLQMCAENRILSLMSARVKDTIHPNSLLSHDLSVLNQFALM